METLKDQEKINLIIQFLKHDLIYAQTASVNSKNGGLIALAAVSIALGTDHIHEHLESIIPPLLNSFADSDSKVKYYACEALYNVTKVGRRQVLEYFDEIFDVLAKVTSFLMH